MTWKVVGGWLLRRKGAEIYSSLPKIPTRSLSSLGTQVGRVAVVTKQLCLVLCSLHPTKYHLQPQGMERGKEDERSKSK